MKYPVKLYTTSIVVDEDTTLLDMKQLCPNFFSYKFGKRETYHLYRGCLICRHTVQFTGEPRPTRRTAVYLFTKDLEGSPNFYHILDAELSIRQAKRGIDRVLEQGKISA